MVAASSNLADAVIVFDLVLLKEVRNIDDRLTQQLAFHQVKQNQQATNAPIAIQEGVDGFKLIMDQGSLNQWVIGLAAIDVLLKLRHGILHILHIGRNVPGIL